MSSRIGQAARLVVLAIPSVAALGLAAVLVVLAGRSGLATDLAHEGLVGSLRLLFGEYAFWVIVTSTLVMLGAAAGHYAAVGPKRFSHEGGKLRVFSLATRVNHWIATASCTLLIVTGMVMLAAAAPGPQSLLEGTGIVQAAWRIHGVTALVFVLTALFMLGEWTLPMLPRRYDLGWLKIVGGYLSKQKRPVPAHKFNAGQKMWFWVAMLGGLVLGGTGLVTHLFVGGTPLLNLVAMVHHLAATAIVVMYGVHVYMATLAVQGSLSSMIDGDKPEEEVAILHPLYFEELQAAERSTDGEVAPASGSADEQPSPAEESQPPQGPTAADATAPAAGEDETGSG